VTRRILVGELDGFVLGRSHAHSGQSDCRDQGLDEHTFHGFSPKIKGRTLAIRRLIVWRTRSDNKTKNQ
jgi:hypothetical protein